MLFKRNRTTGGTDRPPVFVPKADEGLSSAQVREREASGLANAPTDAQGDPVWRILRKNLFTFFNLLNFALAFAVIAVGSYENALFMGVILSNIVIGTVQELRAHKAVEKLRVVTAPNACVIRDGKRQSIPVEKLVRDDAAVWSAGMQIACDCEVLAGVCEVNESLLTGESDPVVKNVGDKLLSGSFVVSGECVSRVACVGDESYAAKLTASAKKIRGSESTLMRDLNRLIRWIGVFILPVGGLLFYRMYVRQALPLKDAVVQATAAMVGMIPEGLILLTSIALALGVIRLAQKRTLVRQLACIETLARVDTVCLDKTGTLTTGELSITDILPLAGSADDVRRDLARLAAVSTDSNPTMCALKAAFPNGDGARITHFEAFSSARKWSGAAFAGQGSVILGAPTFVLRDLDASLKAKIDALAGEGLRVLLLARSETEIGKAELPHDLTAEALIVLRDTLRPEAAPTLAYFAAQGVDIRIISGDDPRTVACVAKAAGMTDTAYVDLAKLDSDDALADAARLYKVFGRVSPEQKRKLVQLLHAQGHTVAMTGDGVNDVAALKEADCSIAMASGSDAARQLSDIVLLDSDFSCLPHVVAEGRRVINNITRSASLFLIKTVFSCLLALIMLFAPYAYPFEPIQLTLFSTLAIGIPSFLLAFEPDTSPIRRDFLKTVLLRALPVGVCIALGVLTLMFFGARAGLSDLQTRSIALLFTVALGVLSLLRVCRPFDRWRVFVLALSILGFAVCILFLPGLFKLSLPGGKQILWILAALVPCGLIVLLADRKRV